MVEEDLVKQYKRKKKKHRALKGKAAKRKMPQAVRLEMAKKWLTTYTGDNILKAYRKNLLLTE